MSPYHQMQMHLARLPPNSPLCPTQFGGKYAGFARCGDNALVCCAGGIDVDVCSSHPPVTPKDP
eukprot:1997429-Amphidinium_carterae.1